MKHTKQNKKTITGFVVRDTETNEYLAYSCGFRCWVDIDEAAVFDRKTEKAVLKFVKEDIVGKTIKVIKAKRTIVKTTTTEVNL
jgi:hypothetical protein